ncbi:hypothetical protein X727_33160 [Mesorhizobium sp. L103C119B0]|nr:hypothetical protein X727_33160 [Mesorhizobium sp. L103C119B0]
MVLVNAINAVLLRWIRIGFNQRLERSCKRFVASQEAIVSRSVWLRPMMTRSGRP